MADQEQKIYKNMMVRFYQERLGASMYAELSAYVGDPQWEFTINNYESGKSIQVYEGNLQQTIELILLGKVLKDQLQKIDKAEPVAPCTS
jgi:hypothetical protein